MKRRRSANAPASLRRDVGRTLAVAVSVSMLVVLLTMALGIRHEVDDLLDDALQEAAEVLYGTLVLHVRPGQDYAAQTLPAPGHEERLVWQVVDADQRVLLRSHRAPEAAMLAALRPGHQGVHGAWRVYAMVLPEPGRMLLVGRDAMENLEARYEAIVIVGAGGLLAGIACAWWIRRRVARALQPLYVLSAQIQAYDPLRPATELAPPSHREFVDVHAAILDLGGRLARRIEREQAFAAHAAHALRTPLAGMQAQLAVAMQELPASAAPRLARVREAAQRLTRVITALLALFRSQAGPEVQTIWVADVVGHLAVTGLEVSVEQAEPLRADANLLAAALANLLDNARRAGARHCRIRVRPGANGTELELRDDGAGLPQQQIDRIMARMQEPDADDDTAGLGLRLAALVARAHRGRLVLASGLPDGSGLVVRMSLWERGAEPDPAAGVPGATTPAAHAPSAAQIDARGAPASTGRAG